MDTVMNALNKSFYTELMTEWEISPPYRVQLEKYYLLHWSSEYFHSLQNHAMILHQGVEYLTVYYKCLPYHLDPRSGCKELRLSFRKIALFPYGYVLVKPHHYKLDLEV